MSYWFEYFPGNYMWSRGMLKAIELARWGAGAIGEVDRIGRALRGREGDNEAWYAAWTDMAERMEAAARRAAAQGHRSSAGSHWLHAATYHFIGERFLPPGSRKVESYRHCLRCFDAGTALRHPNLTRVEVPYEGTTLPGRFLASAHAPGRAPTVVFFDGLDDAKEMTVLFGGIELANRGMHVLAIDGPGQGESLRLRGVPTRHDYEVPAAAAYDFVASRADVDPARVAVMGYSMGGYYAPRAAAFEHRYAACVAWSGHYDYHAVWLHRRKVLEAGGTKASVPGFQLPWILGVADMDTAMERLRRFTLEGVAGHIRCPLLVVHGRDDDIVPVACAERLHAEAGSADKTLRIFEAEEGGSGHGQGDNLQLGANFVADWLASRLGA